MGISGPPCLPVLGNYIDLKDDFKNDTGSFNIEIKYYCVAFLYKLITLTKFISD